MSESRWDVVDGARGGRGRRAWRRSRVGLGLAALVMILAGCMPVSGAFTAQGHFVFYECYYAQEFLTGSGDWEGLGPVTMDFEFCIDIGSGPGQPWPIKRGSFTFTTASGTLTGDIGGHKMGDSPDPDGWFPGRLIFTVTGGTGDLEGATGSLVAEIRSKYVPPTNREMTGTVSGTLTLPGGDAEQIQIRSETFATTSDVAGEPGDPAEDGLYGPAETHDDRDRP